MTKSSIEILECTLRDGSYSIDFQFTPRDTAIVAAALESNGFTLIEIGHGSGLNASATGKGVAAASDEEYMKAAATTLKKAKWGMFFIPGIGRHEDLDMAAEYGMDFVRIGTNANETEQSETFISHAKRLGMTVSANLMKSYIYPPAELALKAKMSQDFGVDMVCLVDSAGTMLPEDVKHYVVEMKSVLTVPVGLHCHDNLSLGIANCLAAIEAGVKTVDTTLQGMGRGGGNPATEILLTVLRKKNLDLGIDVNRVMDISQKLIRPLVPGKGLDAIDITSGYAGFHSSYLGTILKYANLYSLDPRDLIVEVCRADRVEASEDFVQDISERLQRQEFGSAGRQMVYLPQISFPGDRKSKDGESLAEAIQQVAKGARTIAKKSAKQSVLNIVASSSTNGRAVVSKFIQEDFGFVIVSVELDNAKYLEDVVVPSDGIVDILLVDADLKEYLDEPLVKLAKSLTHKSHVVGYSDYDVWIRSVYHEIRSLVDEVFGCSIVICGAGRLSLNLAMALADQGGEVRLFNRDMEHQFDRNDILKIFPLQQWDLSVHTNSIDVAQDAQVIVSFAMDDSKVRLEMVEAMRPNGIVFDAIIGGLPSEVIVRCNQRGIRVVRPDMRAAIASELASLLGTERIVNELMGRKLMDGVPVVAGGLLGNCGEIVLDSLSNPSKIIGVADGKGFLLEEGLLNDRDRGRIGTVEQSILKNLVS